MTTFHCFMVSGKKEFLNRSVLILKSRYVYEVSAAKGFFWWMFISQIRESKIVNYLVEQNKALLPPTVGK